MSIFKSKYAKVILGSLGAILIGAVGSGVWEAFLKPVSITSRDLLLNIVSLGLNAYHDNIYHDISKGFHEKSSVMLLGLAMISFSYISIFALIYIYETMKKIKNSREEFAGMIDRQLMKINNKEETQTDLTDDLKNELIKKRVHNLELQTSFKFGSNKFIKGMTYIIICSVLILLSVNISTIIHFTYVNSAVTYHTQLLKITSPYLSEADRLTSISKFSQIKNKDDYIVVCNFLESVAKKNKQSIPDFTPW